MSKAISNSAFEESTRGYQKEDRPIHPIRKCVVDGSSNIYFIRANRHSLVAAGENSEAIARIKTRIVGDTLYIEQEGVNININGVHINVVGNGCVLAGGNIYIGGNGRTKGATTVITASTQAIVGIALPEAPSFIVRGSADVVLQDVQQQSLDLSIRGAGDIEVAGVVGRFNVEIAGSGDVDACELISESACLSIAGSGDIDAHVTKQVQARIAGSGDIKVRGNPPIRDHSVAGSGKVRFK